MKHYAPSAFQGPTLLTDEQIRAEARSRLEDLDRNGWPLAEAKAQLARELAINQSELSRLLRGQIGVTPAIAEKLGFRAVTRFERVG